MAQTAKNVYKAGSGSMGRNVKYSLTDKGILTITVDLSAEQGASASGKSNIIASTDGNSQIDGGSGAVIGLNIYRKIAK